MHVKKNVFAFAKSQWILTICLRYWCCYVLVFVYICPYRILLLLVYLFTPFLYWCCCYIFNYSLIMYAIPYWYLFTCALAVFCCCLFTRFLILMLLLYFYLFVNYVSNSIVLFLKLLLISLITIFVTIHAYIIRYYKLFVRIMT